MAQKETVFGRPVVAGGDFFELLERSGLSIPDDTKEAIRRSLRRKLNYNPVILFLGKTGVGKSSTCNRLFGKEICPVSDVEACTRDPQELLVSIDGQGLRLIDVPGMGENAERDAEYSELYKKLLPEADAVLWLLKADERAYGADQEVYQHLVKPHVDDGKAFLILLNQIDKIEPSRDWDEDGRRPGPKQQDNIHRKVDAVSLAFDVPNSKIIPISAGEGYNLHAVIEELVFALPADKKVCLFRETPEENRTETSKKEAEKGFWQVVDETIEKVLPPDVVIVYRAAKDTAQRVVDWFKSWW